MELERQRGIAGGRGGGGGGEGEERERALTPFCALLAAHLALDPGVPGLDPGDKNSLLLFLRPPKLAVRTSGAWGHGLSCPKNNRQSFLSANVSSVDLKCFLF